jgi:pilus assembly protein FimV
MPPTTHSAIVGALIAFLAADAMALGVGKTTNLTTLGHPLSFSVSVRLDADEILTSDCIAVDAYAGENRLPPSTLRWALEPGSEPTERTLRIASTVVVDEPVVNLNVQFSCPTRLTRKFVALVDPPTVALAQAAALATAPLLAAQTVPTTAPVLAAAMPSPGVDAAPTRAAQRQTRRAPARTEPARAAAVHRAVASAGHAPAAPRPHAPAATTARAPAARLEVAAMEDAATRARIESQAASAVMAAAAPDSAASAAEDPAAIRTRERMQALEDSLARLQAEGRATQASLAQLQIRLREAESERYANGLVYALGALAAALAGALVLVLWRRPVVQSEAQQWWAPPAAVDAKVPEDSWHASLPAAPAGARRADDVPPVETTASPMQLSRLHALAHETSGAGGRAVEPNPEMAVEELIDLEQQAEFFVVLGQEDAAIDLLMSHLRSSGGASPLPYLKLLEIFRRRGDREASERIRERFNRRFNAYAPEWQTDPMEGRTLTDYPSVIASLQSLWTTPAEAMRSLEASLFRRDGATSTFDLPAYRELLFLYSVARDLTEREVPVADVDLLLPIGADGAAADHMTRLHSNVAPVRLEPPVDVDVDITELDPGPGADDRPSQFFSEFDATSSPMALAIATSNTRH